MTPAPPPAVEFEVKTTSEFPEIGALICRYPLKLPFFVAPIAVAKLFVAG